MSPTKYNMTKNTYPKLKTVVSGLEFLLSQGRRGAFNILETFNGRVYPSWYIKTRRANHRLHLVREGRVEYTAQPDHVLTLDAGGIIWIPPNSPFTARIIGPNPWLCSVVFDIIEPVPRPQTTQILPGWWAASFDLDEWLSAYRNLERISHATRNDSSQLLFAAASSGLHLFFGLLYESIFHLADDQGVTTSIMRVRRHLDTHPKDPLDLEALSAIAQLNPHYLTRLFKTQIGMTVKSYYIESKMRYARSMLKEGFVNVAEISHQLGYSEPSAFSRAFKASQGIPPSSLCK